jgi:hypothetical protein
MKQWKKITIGCSSIALVMGTLFTASYAWFRTNNGATLTGQGATASAYFAGGDGSAEKPYIINAPIHLYNLAWLQYLGYFNQTDSSNVYQQKYFVLGADVDMSSTSANNWTLPPIGTTTNPFIGNFNGEGYTISNLSVDNAIGTGHITRKPSSVGSTLSGVNIVGTFGVIGPYGSVPAGYTYSSAVNSVSNVYLNNVEVKSQTSLTLIGIAAGYVNAAVTGVGVAGSKITVNSGVSALSSSLTTNISDYTTIGYATSAYLGQHYVSTSAITTPTKTTSFFSYKGSGSASGWGGSIGMQAIYDRLNTYRSDSADFPLGVETETRTYALGQTTPTVTTTNYASGYLNYYYDSTTDSNGNDNRLKGKYCFGWNNSDHTSNTNYIYLYGSEAETKAVTTTRTTQSVQTIDAYYVSSNGYYLTLDTNSGEIVGTTSQSSATKWIFSGSSGSITVSTIYNGTTYYLALGTGTPSITTTSTTINFASNRLYYISQGWFSNTNYYLYYSTSNGEWTASKKRNTAGTLTQTATTDTQTVTTTTTENTTESNGVTTPDTYFPLNVQGSKVNPTNPNLPSTTNTGYVVSGANFHNTDWPYRSGDVRVSSYPMSSIYYALNSNSYSNAALEVVTRTYKSGGFVRVTDNYNSAHSSVNGSLTTAYPSTPMTVANLGLTKYDDSRDTLGGLFYNETTGAASSTIYGLHFMNAPISSTNIATADLVRVKKPGLTQTDYTSYQMPRNSIDFNVDQRGFINFFAGSYFGGNNSFFSLNRITRKSGEKEIDTIKHITNIYALKDSSGNPMTSKDYIYKYEGDSTYSDGNTYSTIPTTWVEMFNSSWIEAPTILNPSGDAQGAVYYFEIPVNAGEFCLGSVTGKTGAYLLYLDISANAQEIDRTTVLEKITTTTGTYIYPLGVAVVSDPTTTKESVVALNSVAIALNAGFSGTITLSKSASTITFTSVSTSLTAGFKGDSIALAKAGSTDPPTVTPSSTTTSTMRRLTYIDYNVALGKYTTTSFWVVNTDGTDGTTQYSQTDNDGNAISNPTSYMDSATGTDKTFASGLPTITTITGDSILTYSYGFDAASSTITVNFSLTHAKDGSVSGYTYDNVTGYTITMASTTADLTVTVSVYNNAYVINFTANGTTTTVTAVGNTITVTHG